MAGKLPKQNINSFSGETGALLFAEPVSEAVLGMQIGRVSGVITQLVAESANVDA